MSSNPEQSQTPPPVAETPPSTPPDSPTPQAEASPPPSDDDALRAALDAGIAAADGDKPAADAGDEEPVVGGEPEADAPEATADKPADAKPEDGKPAEVDEAVALGLKPKAAERFHQLNAAVKEMAPVKEALAAANLKIEDVPRVIERAKQGDEFIGMVQKTGATPEQFGAALQYLECVNAAAQGDDEAAEAAFLVMSKELEVLAKRLGRDVPGVVDALAEHADLREEVEDGNLSRARALEIAAGRNRQAVAKQIKDAPPPPPSPEQVAKAAFDEIQQWDAAMRANPQVAAVYIERRGQLDNAIKLIQRTKPPAEWAGAAKLAWDVIAAMPAPTPQAPPKTRPPVGHVALRPTGNAGTFIPEAATPAEALDFGIQAASQ